MSTSRPDYRHSLTSSTHTNRRMKNKKTRHSSSHQLESLEPRVVLDGVPVITEFMAINDSIIQDDSVPPEFPDWIEIYNPDAVELSLNNWYLTDDAANLTKWAFPNDATIAANSYDIVFASDRTPVPLSPQLHTNFKLSGGGEFLALVFSDGVTTTIQQAFDSNNGEFPNQFSDISYGLDGLDPLTSPETYFLVPTPRATNGGPTSDNPAAQIIITEIMYHPQSGDNNEEFIEIYNNGLSTVDLTNWQFTNGVDFTFGAVTIDVGNYLVIAADVATFNTTHPGITNVVGGWTGQLSNSGEEIELSDDTSDRIDRVQYADQGDWAVRRRSELDNHHRGWIWQAEHDGTGKTLELINIDLTNSNGQNWSSSSDYGGSPGVANSVTSSDIAPIIRAVSQSPLIPTSTDIVTITARLTDELTTGLSAELFYRIDGEALFSSKTMVDDGTAGDVTAGDGIFSVTLDPDSVAGDFTSNLTNFDVIEYYVQATDTALNSRAWPAPAQLGPNIVGRWTFDETVGSVSFDLSGGGNDGVLKNGAAFDQAGQFGGAVNLDGVDDFVQLEERVTAEPPLGLAEFTIATWFQRTGDGITVSTGSGGVNAEPLVAKGRTNSADDVLSDVNYFLGLSQVGLDWVLAADFEEHVAESNPGQNHPLEGTTPIVNGQWYHAVVTYNGTDFKLFLDGSQEDSAAVSGLPNWEGTQFASIGNTIDESGVAAGAFNGKIDEVYLFDGAIDQIAIDALRISNSYSAGPGVQAANALYQIDNSTDTGDQPFYRVIMTEAERAELASIGGTATCGDIFDLNSRCDARSNAQMNTTFITSDRVDQSQRHNAGVRLRGNNSRVVSLGQQRFNNYRINLPRDNKLDNISRINLNVRDTESQLAGFAIFQAAGLASADARAVQLRINGTNDLSNPPNDPNINPHFGSYLQLEALDSDFVDEHFPDDSAGNLYRGVRDRRPSPDDEADFEDKGSDPDLYRKVYRKQTNSSADDYSDIIALSDAFSNFDDATFAAQIGDHINVDQWLRYIALDALLNNNESGLNTGVGDDYAMYRGVDDPRFVLVPHDLDTILGRGNDRRSFDSRGIYSSTGLPAINRLLKHPAFAAQYLWHVRDLIQTVMSPEQLNPMLDNLLGGFVTQSVIDGMKAYAANRNQWILDTQINSLLTVQSSGTTSPAAGTFGFEKTLVETVSLQGEMNAFDTQSILINGVEADLTSWQGAWSISGVTLNPGVNRIIVQAFDGLAGTGTELDRTFIDIWYDTNSGGGTGATFTIPLGSDWKFLDTGVDLTDTWRPLSFDDSGWDEQATELGYGDGDENFVVNCGPSSPACNTGNFITTYFRKEFAIPAGDAAKFTSLSIDLKYDDAVSVFLNGTEIIRENLPGTLGDNTITSSTLALGSVANENAITTFNIALGLLQDGQNILAVEIHQRAADSSDISFNLELRAVEQLAGGLTQLSGTLSGDTTLTAAAGPYHVTADLIVPVGATLTIEPGTSIYFDRNTQITVNGYINAQGTPYERIRLTALPGSTLEADIRPQLPQTPPKWDGVRLNNTTFNGPDQNIISFLDIEHAQDSQGAIGAINSEILVDNVSFGGTHLRMFFSTGSSVRLQNSFFPDMFAADEFPASMSPSLDNVSEHVNGNSIPLTGYYVIEGNIFGSNKGHNDVIDIISNQRPNAILVMRNNIFMGAGDEAYDGAGDFLVEGNVFVNFAKDIDNTGTGDSNVISTADAGPTVTSLVRNTFINIDHVINFKNEAYGFLENNTIVNVSPGSLSLPIDPPSRQLAFSAINFLIPNESNPETSPPRDPPGLGAYTAGNLFINLPASTLPGQIQTEVFGHVDFVNPNINPPANHPANQLLQILEVHDTLVTESHVFDNSDLVNGRSFDYSVGDPRFIDPDNDNYQLGPGSPAIGAGPNGLDIGALVAEGASISGEPTAITSSTDATLTIGGPGIFRYQYKLNNGTWSSMIDITPFDGGGRIIVGTDPQTVDPTEKIRSVELALNGLTDGTYTVFVRGENFAGELQSVPTESETWTVDTTLSRVLINEVLASNLSAFDLNGTRPDLIELYNDGVNGIDLTGMSISDNSNNPTKFVFPAVTISPGEYLTLFADSEVGLPGEIHLGFSLSSTSGEGVFFYDTLANSSALLDSIEFGVQIPNFSIARVGHLQQWALAQPTFGQANIEQRTGDTSQLKINEWFTSGQYDLQGVTKNNDFVELFNPDTLPVALGGLHLTDQQVPRPGKHQIAPLSFITAGGTTAFIADNDPQDGANHVNFRLASEQGSLGLFTSDTSERIDLVFYGPQRSDSSQGRSPDGGPNYQFFAQPTPGLDTTPPSIPTGLQFTLNTPTQIDIAWDASTDSVSGVAEYVIYRNSVEIARTANTSFSDTTVIAETVYSYEVSAVNSDGFESAHSSSIINQADLTPPTIPENVTATTIGNSSITLGWDAATDPETGVQLYTIYKDGVEIGTSATTSFVDSSISIADSFFYQVSATNGDDTESFQSLKLNVIMFQDGVSDSGNYSGTRDAWIRENNPTDNHGADNPLDIDGDDPNGSGNENLALISWDISSIPTGATIDSAAMSYNVINESGTLTYDVFTANRSWNENETTWNEASTGTNWQTAGARGASDRGTTVLASVGSSSTGRRTFALNSAGVTEIEQWINNAANNFGFIISGSTNTNGSELESREAAAGNRPRLVVTYYNLTDVTPPSQPTNLNSSDDGVSEITLTWTASFDGESGIDHYNIYRDASPIGTSTTTSFVDSGRTPGVQYDYTVSAVNGVAIESSQTAVVSHTIAIDATTPLVPTGLAATDNGISDITLTWNASSDTESGISGYRVFRDSVDQGTVSGTTFVDNSVAPEVLYTYEVVAINGQLLESSTSTPFQYEFEAASASIQLDARDTYLPGVPVLLRIDVLDGLGGLNRDLWDATATITTDDPTVTMTSIHTGLPISSFSLFNGRGSTLVTFSGATNSSFDVTLNVNGLEAVQTLTDLTGTPQTDVSGTLPGATTNWSGIIHVIGDVTVPAGHVLTVQPGTLVLLDGNATAGSSSGVDINVLGDIQSLGTQDQPVTFTATDPAAAWGELDHITADPSLYQFTNIHRAGHSPGIGHTGTGPAVRMDNSTITFTNSNITDLAGKTMWNTGGVNADLIIIDSHFARSVMGPEINNTPLTMTGSHITEMLAMFHDNNVDNDNDAIYLHSQQAGQTMIVTNSVFAITGDDGVDTAGANVTFNNAIVRNTFDKAFSVNDGTTTINRSILVDNGIGVSVKVNGGGTLGAAVIDHSTIVDNAVSILRAQVGSAVIDIDITNSIIAGTDSIADDGGPGTMTISYTNTGEVWAGVGNFIGDPMFVDQVGHDYHLTVNSNAIDAGDPSDPLDPDGTRNDIGVFSFNQTAPTVSEVLVNGSTWSQSFLDGLNANSLGDGGYKLPVGSGEQLKSLPWHTVDQIVIRFSEDVTIQQSDLSLAGVNTAEYTIDLFQYDSNTFTATWTLSASIGIDKLLIKLSDSIQNSNLIALDGDWQDDSSNYPSGDGTAGGDFLFRFNVLHGDINQDGTSDSVDLQVNISHQFSVTGNSRYDLFSDLTTDGVVGLHDLLQSRNSRGNDLPAGEPIPPSAPPAAAVAAALLVSVDNSSNSDQQTTDQVLTEFVSIRRVDRIQNNPVAHRDVRQASKIRETRNSILDDASHTISLHRASRRSLSDRSHTDRSHRRHIRTTDKALQELLIGE